MRIVHICKCVFLFGVAIWIVAGNRCNAEETKDVPKETTKTEEASAKPVVLCKDHGVPEDICVLCHPKLAKDFKRKGDWCKEHKVPESQCMACHPEFEAKFKAMAAGKKVDEPKPDEKTEKKAAEK